MRSIPPLPAAVSALSRMVDDPAADARKMAQVIAQDQALTASILRVANSSFYGMSRSISTVQQAIVILGTRGVRSLALGISVLSLKNRKFGALPFDLSDLWRHSLAAASAARVLAVRLRCPDPEEVFVAGLLHDIGMILLAEHAPERYGALLKQAEIEGIPLHFLEQREFGIAHAQVGAELCKRWNIPSNIVEGILWHDRAIPETKDVAEKPIMAQLVRVANELARISRIGSDGDQCVQMDFLANLGKTQLRAEHLRVLLLALPEEVRKSEIFFNLDPSASEATAHPQELIKICVSMTDARGLEIVTLCLLALGYGILLPEYLNASLQSVGIVSDGPLPPSLTKILGKGTPILDISKRWKTAGPFPLHHLENWLKEAGIPVPSRVIR